MTTTDRPKVMVYKTPTGWAAQCTCGVATYPTWRESMAAAERRALVHTIPLGALLLTITGGRS